MRWILLCGLALGCSGESTQTACDWLVTSAGCDECADGEVTCSFEDASVTAMSCGGCQAEAGLMQALCDAGSTATAQEILDGMVCEDAATEE